ncbi:MAG: ABC transporter permease, partial [Acidobacteria bacterium]|nr:ABC transporter permease [Acidobacteriota bacterium]
MRWWRRKERERDLERELRADLDLEAAERREQGLSDDEARYAARHAFGNVTLIAEDTRATWGWTWLERLGQDLRYALRTARRNPGFAAIAVLTLGLGIGVNTAVFSVVNTVLLRKPPYVEPDRLVTLRQKLPKLGDISMGACPAEYLDYRDRTRAFSSLAGYEDVVFDLTGGAEPVRVQAQHVTHTLFATLGVSPLAGRLFSPAEDQPGGGKVAIVSHEFWQRHFGGGPDTVGAVIRLDEQPYTVIGIMPAGFEFPFTAASVGEPPALWTPMAFTAARIQDRAAEFPVHIVARLRPGVSLAQAGQDVQRVAGEFQREHAGIYSGNVRLQVDLDPLGAGEAARARPVLLALAGAVIFVLLIACANVTNLLLARAAARQPEFAMRLALGARRRRLIRQLLIESLLLAALGGVCGVVMAHWGTGILVAFLSTG